MLDEFGRDDSAQRVPASPNVRTDGSLVLDEVSGATSAGSGALWIHVGGFVLFLDACRQLRGLSFGCHPCPASLGCSSVGCG